MKSQPRTADPGRQILRFAQSVTEHFAFLSEHFGFWVVLSDSTLVTWHSRTVFVNVYHGRSSYELHLEVGRLGEQGEVGQPFSMEELIRLKSPDKAKQFRYFAGRTQKQVNIGVAQLANLLRQYGEGALSGNPEVFSKLWVQRRSWLSQFVKEGQIERVRRAAEVARQIGDWAELARLYQQIRPDLTPVEAKRLDYSLKRIHRPPTKKGT